LDEAFGLFLLKCSAEIQSNSKKPGGENKPPQQGQLKIKKETFQEKMRMLCWITISGISSLIICGNQLILTGNILPGLFKSMANERKTQTKTSIERQLITYTMTHISAMTALPIV